MGKGSVSVKDREKSNGVNSGQGRKSNHCIYYSVLLALTRPRNTRGIKRDPGEASKRAKGDPLTQLEEMSLRR